MPKWIHDRAKRLLDHNPSMPEGEAFAIATQQAHAVGKSPKGYGTAEGREVAREKYDTPKDDQKTAGPRVELYMRVKEAEGVAEVLPTAADPRVTQRFGRLVNTLRTDGVLAGTAHRRLLIPKDKLTEDDVHSLGFVPVTIAIPEAGQDRFRSFRHPDSQFHIHSHPEGWTMHEDAHPASTMLARKVKGIAAKSKALVSGLPHVSEEGLPGLGYYIKGKLSGHASTARRVAGELPAHVKRRIASWSPSPTYVAPDPTNKTAEALEGGKGDGHRPSDFNAAALAKGTRHEREHTSDDAVAREIAMDHLTEDPRYYDKADLIENPRPTPLLRRLAKAEERRGEKHAFETSMYSGPLSYGPFKQESDLPPFRAPTLARQAPPRRAQTELGAAVTHEKVGGLADRALSAAGRGALRAHAFATIPKGVEAHAEGLTGLNRVRQMLGGQRAEHLYQAYQEAEGNPAAREKILLQLSGEDSQVLRARLLAGVGATTALTGAAQGAATLAGKGVQAAGRKVIQKKKETAETAAERKADPEAFLHKQLDARGIGETGKSIASRFALAPNDTNRITVGDVLTPPTAAFDTALIGSVLAKPGVERLVGAQSFSHGTSPAAVRSILQSGLDPAYGGIEGGAAHQQELLAQKARGLRAEAGVEGLPPKAVRGLHREADRVAPQLPLMGIDQHIPMDSHDFVNNAKGRTYVAKGVGGQAAAALYSHLQDPTPWNEFRERQEKMPLLKGMLGGSAANQMRLGRDYFYPKKDARIVGGVLPTEDFHAQFEPDPDDVTRFQTGWRSKRGPGEVASVLSHEHLHTGTPTFRQIFKAHARDYGKYVKNNPGRVASGAVMTAIPTAMAASTLYNTKRVVDKIRGTHKTDAQKKREKEQAEASAAPPAEGVKAAAPLSPTARLSSAQQVGKTPNMDTGGPSIQQIAKPVGFGIKLPGAGKGTTTI